jgi:DNA-binding NarL/FixJ family response regulator
VARGQRNLKTAGRLGVTEKTVRNNVSTLLMKLQAADRTQTVARARDAGLGALGPG